MLKKGFAVGIVFLFLITIFPYSYLLHSEVEATHSECNSSGNFSALVRLLFPHHMNNESLKPYIEKYSLIERDREKESLQDVSPSNYVQALSPKSEEGLMDSPWPMFCHDLNHSGQSPFSTENTTVLEKWRFITSYGVEGSPILGKDGTVYVGDFEGYFNALLPNGTLKWRFPTAGDIWCAAALDDNETIYFGTFAKGFYALYPNGTQKWYIGGKGKASSPAIASDGTIIYSDMGGKITSLYPNNGTIKWSYQTGDTITTSPAIAQDGTIYCSSFDGYLYALNPNGTLKWRFLFHAWEWSHGSPTIAADGTIYFGADDDYLYAVNPNGSLKWKLRTGAFSQSPALDKNGIIYIGTVWNWVDAVYPNGTMKWSFNLGSGDTWLSSIAISKEGTLYVGVQDGGAYVGGGDILALNPNGTQLWRKRIGTAFAESAPCIGKDGTVYIGSSSDRRKGPGNNWMSIGYVHAFGPVQSNHKPNPPLILGDNYGYPRVERDHWFKGFDQDNNPLELYVDWGDGTFANWSGEYAPNELVVLAHKWTRYGNYTVRAKVRDVFGEESDWSTFHYRVCGIPLHLALYNGTIYDWYDYCNGVVRFKAKDLVLFNLFPPLIRHCQSGEEIYIIIGQEFQAPHNNYDFGIIYKGFVKIRD